MLLIFHFGPQVFSKTEQRGPKEEEGRNKGY